jgi:hypothetical protein
MTTSAEPDRALLLAIYQVERAADGTQMQGFLGLVSLALVYMGGVSAVVSGSSSVPLGLLLVLPLPAIGLMNLLIVSQLQWLARHWYIQQLERAISGQPGRLEPLEYRFPYWQRYMERIFDPQVAAPVFKPLSLLWPLMPLVTFTAFVAVLVVMAFQRADQFATYALCAIVAASYLGLFVLGIGTFVLGVRTLMADFRFSSSVDRAGAAVPCRDQARAGP